MSALSRVIPSAALVALLMVAAAPVAAVTATAAGAPDIRAAVVAPPGFSTAAIGSVAAPTALAAMPDGRMLVTSQRGQMYAITGGVVGTAPVLDLSDRVCRNSERGLLGVAADPDAATRALYVFYTRRGSDPTCPTNSAGGPVPAGAPTNRVSRFVMGADGTVDPATETVLLDGIYSPAGNHNAGDLFVGTDGYLYISTGDGGCDYRGGASEPGGSGCAGANDAARDLNILNGKILRITRSGGIPSDNPFVGANTASCARGPAATGLVCRETFATGLRNPFRIAMKPGVVPTQFRINDVGQDTWEEIDAGVKGADYGWNTREGLCARTGSETNCGAATPAGMTDPVFVYGHSTGCESITGGAFVPDGIWPSAYQGAYLYSDYVCGKIRSLSPAGASTDLVTGLGVSSAVALAFGKDGATTSLYYTSYASGGTIHRLRYTGTANRAPTSTLTAAPWAGAAPLAVTLDGTGSTDPDGDALTYLWTFGDGSPGATTSAPTVVHSYRAGIWTAGLRVRDAKGALSVTKSWRISSGNYAPKPTITSPAAGDTFTAGTSYTLSGSATDAEDGTVPAARLVWTIERRHDQHTHPFLGPVAGRTVSFVAPGPENLAAAADSDLRITLKATDSRGISTTVRRTFTPNRVAVTFVTEPAGRTVIVDGSPFAAPVTLTSWAGSTLQLDVPAQTTAEGVSYEFASWSDLRPAGHAIVVPAESLTMTATLRVRPVPPGVPTGVTAIRSGPGAVKLSWSAPATAGDSPITEYRVTRSGTDAGGAGPVARVLAADAASVTFTNLVAGRTYTFTVAAMNSGGQGPTASVSKAVD